MTLNDMAYDMLASLIIEQIGKSPMTAEDKRQEHRRMFDGLDEAYRADTDLWEIYFALVKILETTDPSSMHVIRK